MTIRFAEDKDAFNIFRLLIKETNHKTDEELRNGNYFQKWFPVLQKMLTSDFLKIFVAVNDNDTIIGVTTFYILPRLELAGNYAVVEDVFVKEDEQSQGVGTHLLTEIIAYAKQNQVKFISAPVDPQNEKAMNFYAKLGFVHETTEMKYKFE